MAPEVKTRKNYDHRCDMYSFGIVYFEIIHPPFKTQTERVEVLNNLRREKIQFPTYWTTSDWEAQTNQIRRLLHHAPEKRVLLEYELSQTCRKSRLSEDQKDNNKRFRARPYGRSSKENTNV